VPVNRFSGSSAVCVFTKIPGLARCKTRLINDSILSEEEVERLAKAFLADALTLVRAVSDGTCFVVSEPVISAAELRNILSTIPLAPSLELLSSFFYRPQSSEPFGIRLQTALNEISHECPCGLVILGSDSPTLSTSSLHAALENVESGNFVLGPAMGGGIYLIGIPRQAFQCGFSLADVFQSNVGTELQNLALHMAEFSFPIKALEFGFDVDVKEDLVTLISIAAMERELQRTKPKQADTGFPLGQSTKAVLEGLALNISQSIANTRSSTLVRRR